MKKEQRVTAWAVTSPRCPLYFLGEGAYLKPDPFAIFKEPEDAFRYFVHIEEAREAKARMIPVTTFFSGSGSSPGGPSVILET